MPHTLNVNVNDLIDHQGCKDLNITDTLTSWKIILFMYHNEDNDDFLKSVRVNSFILSIIGWGNKNLQQLFLIKSYAYSPSKVILKNYTLRFSCISIFQFF